MANTEKSQAELYREQRKARLAKEQKRKNRKKLGTAAKVVIALVVVAVIAGCVAGVKLVSGGVKYRQLDVISIEGVGDVSSAEYAYYYNSINQNYFSQAQQAEQYAQYYGYSSGKDLMGGFDYTVSPELQKLSQTTPEYDEIVKSGVKEPTWADLFDYVTKQNIAQFKTLCKLAGEAGYKLDDEAKAEIKEAVANVKQAAAQNYVSTDKFLSVYYGKGVTLSLYKQLITNQEIAQHYAGVLNDEYRAGLSDDEIQKYYKDNAGEYNIADFAYYYIAAEKKTTKNEEGEDSSAVTSATMKAAKEKAEALKAAGSYKELAAMVEALGKDAKLTDITGMSKSDVSQNFGDEIANWLFAKKLKLNTVNVFEMTQSGYVVAIATKAPARDDTKMVSIRTIEVAIPEDKEIEKPKDDATEEEKAEYEEKVQKAKEEKEAAEAARAEADKAVAALDTFKDAPLFNDVAKKTKDKNTYLDAEIILRNYLAGDKTEDAFKALADKQADADPESEDYSDSSLKTHIYAGAGSVEDKVKAWALDKSRKAGDVGIIENDDCYTVVYFVETEAEANWEMNVKDALASEKVADATQHTEFTVTNADDIARIIAGAMEFSKKQIAQAASQSASAGH